MASGLTTAGFLQRAAIGFAVIAAFGSGMTVVVFGLLVLGLAVSVRRPTILWGGVVVTIILSILRPSGLSAVAIGLLVVYAMAALADQPGRSLTDKQSRLGFGAAAFGLLIVSILSVFRFNPPSNDGEGRSTFERLPQQQSDDGDGLLDRLVDAIVRFFRQDESAESGEQGVEGGQPEPPSPEIDWWRVAIAAAIVLLLIALAVLLWRWLKRRRETIEALRPDWAVRRLDKVGSRTVRDRRASETPFTYGNDIDRTVKDGRLERAGELVSDFIYRPPEATSGGLDADDLRSKLDDLEGRPPQRIRKRPIRDRLRRRR